MHSETRHFVQANGQFLATAVRYIPGKTADGND